ncbi:hypothetical protein J1N35_008276 [Gossypium stocksii]|uniref:Uncharacterized protein n=1 Tax=Gossypium stocksii TaxID=47602 RepID=A0A9D4AGB3_9ROSI|nr:hypothetical protein J1N35_008276 [Gossypium stocksii]
MDDVLPTMSTSERSSNKEDVGGSENEDDNESDADPIGSPVPMAQKLYYFLNHYDEESEDPNENVENDPQFKTYSPPTHMHNVDLSVEDGLNFAKLPYRRLSHTSFSLDSRDLKVGKEFSTKDYFVVAVK